MLPNSIISLVQDLQKLQDQEFQPNKVQREILRALQKKNLAKYDFIKLLKKKPSYYRVISDYMEMLEEKQLIKKAEMQDKSPRDRTPYKLTDLGWIYLIRYEYVSSLDLLKHQDNETPFYTELINDLLDEHTVLESPQAEYIIFKLQEFVQHCIMTVDYAIRVHKVLAKNMKNENERKQRLQVEVDARLAEAKNHLIADLHFMTYAELVTGRDIGLARSLVNDGMYISKLDEFCNKMTLGYVYFNKLAKRTPPALRA